MVTGQDGGGVEAPKIGLSTVAAVILKQPLLLFVLLPLSVCVYRIRLMTSSLVRMVGVASSAAGALLCFLAALPLLR